MAASKSPKKGKSKRTKEAGADNKKLSALDAAAKVLAETGQPMSCKEMIEAMPLLGTQRLMRPRLSISPWPTGR